VIGFLFREILNELVELVMTVMNEAKRARPTTLHDEITANEVYEACRRYTYDLNQTSSAHRQLFVTPRSSKKCAFF
jgi:hypothetical protein